ncbi:LOW QUALITY PROTEIN: bactericidal permeability-increasing protein-like [Anomaloglossus baeobatrachus]
MAPSYALTLALFMVILGATDSVNPGLVVRITQKGLDYSRQQGIIVLQQKLSTIRLPDYSGSYSVGVLGNVKYNINSMVITNFQLPSSQVTLLPNVGLTISGAYIEVHGRWGVRYLFISSDGDFELKVLGISVSVGLSLGSDGSGRPTVSSSDCSANIADMQVHFSGGLDWLINLFDDKIASSLRDYMQNMIYSQVNDAVKNQLEPVLRSLPVTSKIDDVASIDYSLTGPPIVSADYLDVQLKGEFFEQSKRTPPPFSPQPLSIPDDHNLMVYFAISDYLFNTAGFVHQSAGKLIFNVTDDRIPKDFPVRLNTSSFGNLIPQISKMYPSLYRIQSFSYARVDYLFHQGVRGKTPVRVRSEKSSHTASEEMIRDKLVTKDLEKVNPINKRHDNLTFEERRVLENLSQNKNLILKPSDKGGNLVILSHDIYKKMCTDLLSDKKTYVILPNDPTRIFKKDLDVILKHALDNKLISKNENDFMSVSGFELMDLCVILLLCTLRRSVSPSAMIIDCEIPDGDIIHLEYTALSRMR